MTSPLLVDVSVYQDRAIPPAAWAQLAAAGPPWHGVILKATEGRAGAAWEAPSLAWFGRHWPAVRHGGGERYGSSWFRGAYHFLRVREDGAAQADHYLATIERAGGWDVGDLWPIVDVESSRANAGATRAQVEDVTSSWVERVRQRTGRDVVLYAGYWLAELGITSRMGCSWLWYAAYTRTLARATYERIGWDAASLWAWQYAGADARGPLAELAGYPHTTPIGDADISALMLPGGIEATRARLWAERPAAGACASWPAR